MSTQITDHDAAALARLPQQLKGKTNAEALVSLFTAPVQDLEDALWQVYTERWLGVAVGDQLDQLGAIVGQERSGLSDTDYEVYIRARILANKSRGVTDDVLAVVRQAVNDSGATITLDTHYPAGFVIRVGGIALDGDLATILANLLRDAASAGVRALLESSEALPADTFTFGASIAVTWESGANVNIVGDTITKNAGGSAWNAGAVSSDYMHADGWAEFTIGDPTVSDLIFGLSNGDTDQSDSDVDFGLQCKQNGTIRIIEGGVDRGEVSATLTIGDVLRVKSAGLRVSYSQNEVLLYTSMATPSYPLLIDTSIYHNGGEIADAVLHWGLVDEVGKGWGDGDATACDLDKATAGYLEITDGAQTGLDLTTDFTIAGFVTLDAGIGASSYTMIGKYTGADNAYYLYIDTSFSPSRIYLVISITGAAVLPTYTTPGPGFTLGQRYHIAARRTTGGGTDAIRFYVDGVPWGSDQTNGTDSALHNSAASFRIGSISSIPWLYFDGVVDEIGVWSEAKSDAFILALATTKIDNSDPTCELAVDFATSDGSDKSSNGNDLTAAGGVTYVAGTELISSSGGQHASAKEGA